MGCAPSPPSSLCSRPLPAVCSASPRCCPTSPCWDFPWLPASSCRVTFPISLRASSPAPRYLGATIGRYSCIGFGQLPRHTPVRRHTRPVRRDVAARRLGVQLRHLWARLPCRCRRHHFPAPQHLAALILSSEAGAG